MHKKLLKLLGKKLDRAKITNNRKYKAVEGQLQRISANFRVIGIRERDF